MRLIPRRKKSSRRRGSSPAELRPLPLGCISSGSVVDVPNGILGLTADYAIINDLLARTFVGVDTARGPDQAVIATYRGVPFVADPAMPETEIAFLRSLPPQLRLTDLTAEYECRAASPIPELARIMAEAEARIMNEFGVPNRMLNDDPGSTSALTIAMIEEEVARLTALNPAPAYRRAVDQERQELLYRWFGFDERAVEMRYEPVAALRAERIPFIAEGYMGGWVNPRGIWGEYYPRPRVDPETAQRSMERARGLLKSLLRPEQWAEFQRTRKFTERIGEDEFEVTPGGMISRRRGTLAERWCINPDPYADKNDYMPVEDMAIAQLLHLRAGPEKLRAQANVFFG